MKWICSIWRIRNLATKESENVKRRDNSRTNGLILSYKKDNFNKVILVKDRQCFCALPILFLFIGNGAYGNIRGKLTILGR